jgi:DNA-binding NtrC family response regulator
MTSVNMAQVKTAQDGTGVWDQFTVSDGLPDMKIECAYGGRDGTLWFGTHSRGIVRYDGDAFVSLGRKEGLEGDSVFSIAEGVDGSMWLGTKRGIWGYDGESFQQLEVGDGLGFLWGVCTGPDGSIWLGAERRPGHKAAVCRVREGQAVIFEIDAGIKEQGESIRCMVRDRAGDIWAGGDAIYRQRAGEGPFEPVYNHELVGNVYAFSVRPGDGGIAVSTDKGVWEIGRQGIRKCIHFGDADTNGLHYFIAFFEASGGRLGGLTHDGGMYLLGEDVLEEMASFHAAVQTCLVDAVGRLWVGTYGMGIYCYDPYRFKIYSTDSVLPDSGVNCLGKDVDGSLLVGTRQGVVTRGEAGFYTEERFKLTADFEVSAIHVDDGGDCWVGGRNGFLLRFGRSAGYEVITEHIDRVRINGIAAAAGRVWFSFASGKGLGYYQGGQAVYLGGKAPQQYPMWIGALADDAAGNVWIGSSDDKLWDGLCRHSGGAFGANISLAGRGITAICAAGDGAVWVGTSEGLARVVGNEIQEFPDGILNEIIRCVYRDGDGVVWIGTEGGGVCCYDGEVAQKIQIDDRPRCNFVNDIIQDESGALWFATEGGLICYRRRRVKPRVVIKEVVADEVYGPGAEITFPTTVSRIEVHFRGLSPQEHAAHMVFRYRLESEDGDDGEGWRATGEAHAVLGKLSPGQYRLEVQAIDRDLNYSEPCSVDFRVIEDPVIAAYSEALSEGQAYGNFVGESKALYEVKKQLKEVAWTNMTVLILGETGTGKGIAARSIHRLSSRKDSPFIYINCGAIPSELIDSELFGHEKGAFTGAVGQKPGKFELANGGTIFLDEIGDLPLASQARLLRVVQEKVIERVGGTKTLTLDVRVIAATNRELKEAVREKRFRQDLYYRLNVFPVYIPPLRLRGDDIPLLCHHFARQFALHLNTQTPTIPQGTMDLFVAYEWPGNVRELEHTIQRAVLLAREGVMRPEDTGILGVNVENGAAPMDVASMPIMPLEEVERAYIGRVLRHTKGVIQGEKGAAKLLGIKPTTLRSRLERLGIDHTVYKRRNQKKAE